MTKTLGQMSPEERAAVISRAASRFQRELDAAAPEIGRIMDAATCPITTWSHVPHGECLGVPPVDETAPLMNSRQVRNRLRDLGHEWTGPKCWHPDCGDMDAAVQGWQCSECGHYFTRPRVSIDDASGEAVCRSGMGCQSTAARLARRMRGHDLVNVKGCTFGTCAEAKDPWTGWDGHGRPVAHFSDKWTAERALVQRVVAATSPVHQ